MNSVDINNIMYDFLLVFSSFFVVFGVVRFALLFFEKLMQNAFNRPPKGHEYG